MLTGELLHAGPGSVELLQDLAADRHWTLAGARQFGLPKADL